MELSYVLTPEDLREAIRVVHVARIQRLRGSVVFFLLSALAVGLIMWPVIGVLFEPLVGRGGATAVWLIVMALATPLAFVIKRQLGRRLLLPALTDWSVKRQTAAALPRSTLGPITLRVSDTGLWRKNEKDELTVGPADVQRLLRAPSGLYVQLRNNRILIVPTRALEASSGFCDAVVRAVGQPLSEA